MKAMNSEIFVTCIKMALVVAKIPVLLSLALFDIIAGLNSSNQKSMPGLQSTP
jgi:hypothetical protein